MSELILRVNDENNQSYGGFQWPKMGPVSAPDWENSNKCGGGLHGWLYGCGDLSAVKYNDLSLWLVVEVDEWIDLGGKVKYKNGNVLYCGDRSTAVDMIQKRYPDKPVIYGTASAGYRGTASAGDGGTASAGKYGTASAGQGGTASAGQGGVICISYYNTRSRVAVGYVGENGIKSGVLYKVDENGRFFEVNNK